MRKKFTMLLAALLACVGVMAQKAHQRVSHEGWVVTALNEAGVYGNEGGVAFIADDNAATFYHSNWSSNYTDGNGVNKGKDGLQAFMVELPHSLSDLSLITYKGRSDNNTSGWARGVRVYVYETLPEGWPTGGLSSLGYTDKEALLASTNANLGTAAFDNTAKLWENNRNQKLVEFATPQSGKYVLFIMESGSDAWLTCSDFQIYQYKEYTGIVEGNPYFLQVTNAAAAAGQWFVDTYTKQDDNGTRNTIGISESTKETYFTWNDGAWRISTNENSDGNYLTIDKWCATPQSETVGKWELFINDDETISLLQRTYDGGSDNSRCFVGGNVVTSADAVKLYTDNAKDKAINIKLVDAGATPVTVTYSLTYGGEEKYTQTVETYAGEEYPDFTATFPFGITATKPAGEIDANEAVEGKITKTIELQSTLPFVPAANYASVENWYYLVFHASQRNYLYYVTDGDVLEANKTAVDANDKDAYTWAFVGDPFKGFKVYNKKAGKYLAAAEGGAVVSANEEQVFDLTASAHGTNGFFMNAQEGAYTQRFNKNQSTGKVVYWDGADAGSTFMVELRDDAAQLAAFVASANDILTNLGEGTTVGYVTADSKDAVAAAIASANTAIENKAGYEAAEIALQAAINALETIQPEAGKFYTIQNAYSNVYMGVGNAGGMVSENAAAIGEVFQFVAAEDDKFYLYNVERGSYLSSAPGHGWGQASATATEASNAKVVTIANLGKENQVSITPAGGTTLHHDANYGTIVGWTGDADSRSAWKIVEVDVATLAHAVAVTEAGWSTLTLGYNATIPAGVTAYAVSEIDGQYAKLTEVTGVIPAGEAVLLNAEAGTYEFKYAESAEPVASNLLEGTVFNTNVAEVAYVLAAKNGVGLYKAAYNVSTDTTNDGEEGVEDDTYEAFLNNAFKAYLPAPANAAAPMFSLERGEGTTAIDSVELTNDNVVIYDLAGRRVEKMEKGIYIVNGKKVIR